MHAIIIEVDNQHIFLSPGGLQHEPQGRDGVPDDGPDVTHVPPVTHVTHVPLVTLLPDQWGRQSARRGQQGQ